MAGILESTPAVLAWMDRMAAVGQGDMTISNATESIVNCLISTWEKGIFDSIPFQDEHGIPLGSRVTIASESFGPEPTEGELVAATRMHYTLRRVDERAGTVHVHFPRIGFVLKKVLA